MDAITEETMTLEELNSKPEKAGSVFNRPEIYGEVMARRAAEIIISDLSRWSPEFVRRVRLFLQDGGPKQEELRSAEENQTATEEKEIQVGIESSTPTETTEVKPISEAEGDLKQGPKAEPKPSQAAPEVEDNTEPERSASPQAEDGHIDIANELAEALAKIYLSSYESRVLWAVFRKTYGWHKKMDQISITQFQKITGMKRRHVSRTLSKLLQKNIVTQIGDSRITTYGFQKDYMKWKDITQIGDDVEIPRVSGQGRKKIVTKISNRSLPKQVTIKETNKRKIYIETDIEFQLACLLFKEIKKRRERLGLPPPKRSNLQAWAYHIELLVRIDGRTEDQIREMILWTQNDHFWGKNICSTEKLREKFGRLEEDMVSEKKGKTLERPERRQPKSGEELEDLTGK